MEKNITRRNFLKQGLVGATLTLTGGCATGKVDLQADLDRLDQCPETRACHRGYGDAYDFEGCVECGACLRECIYKDLTADAAVVQIQKMRAGDVAACEAMLDQCVFCYNCNSVCPVDARPAALMLERLRDRRNREGETPASLRYMINGMADKGWTRNLFQDLYSDQDREERNILEEWTVPKDCGDGDMLWCSCAGRIFPYDIAHSAALAGLPKFGGKSDCCGLPACRSGLFDVARFVSGNLIQRLSQCRFKRLVVMCGSCQEMFEKAMPEYLGVEFPFEVISVYEYLDEEMQKGNLRVRRQLPDDERENVCITHACFGHSFGDAYLSTIERLCRAVGLDCTELAHTGEQNACCGMGGVYRNGNLWDILDVRGVKKKDIKAAGSENILAYCYGCFFISHLFQGGDTYFLLEKILWALGDEIRYPMRGILGRSFNFRSFSHMMAIGPSAVF